VAIRRNMILIGLSRLMKATAPPREFPAVSTLPVLEDHVFWRRRSRKRRRRATMGSFRQNIIIRNIVVIYDNFVIAARTIRTFLLATSSPVWALRDRGHSSRVKIADRGFASRQSASLVSIKRGKF
jgi:hypothetical protein